MTLEKYIDQLVQVTIEPKRQSILNEIADYIQQKKTAESPIRLNFICTHNSRRSQFAQVWAFVLSRHYNLDLEVFSGGVEVTAFNENAVNALKSVGLSIDTSGTKNPMYTVNFQGEKLDCFSKLFGAKQNPTEAFAAIMTCDHADENCPFIPGAEKRIPMTFNDPKAFDGTEGEQKAYAKTCLQIAAELNHVFNRIK